MKVLQISSTDIQGRRFNGHDLNIALNKISISSKHCVWNKDSDDENTFEILPNFLLKGINKFAGKIEKLISIQSVLYPSVLALILDKRFKEADIVHFHLIHDYFFSILALPYISKLKKVVWSLHDPWAITGHCIHPINCEKFKNGCVSCPDLKREFPMTIDNSALMWKLKKKIYLNSNLNLIVASDWMYNIVKMSPLLQEKKIHLIKFGLNLNSYNCFKNLDSKLSLGIDPDSIVLFFRATNNEFKGFNFLREVFRNLETDKKITLLSVDQKGLLNEFKTKFQVVELGWVNDDLMLNRAYAACDIFLMPSTAESFGLMAIEAMASGKVVLTLKGTALEGVVFSPNAGFAANDFFDFLKILSELINNKEKRDLIGKTAQKFAKENYDFDKHFMSILNIYKNL